VLSVQDVMRLPHARERRTVRTIMDRALGAFDVPGVPLRFSEFPDELPLDAPFLGEHNAAVLAELPGYDAARIAALETTGVLHGRRV
jgi:crotonobetainyl-CoA:carnitine CoA-transferase CaiB-like acyl-CoA transferase